MFIDDFTLSTLGNTYDLDGVAGVQCVDLIKLYIRDGFGIPVQPMGNAIQWWTNTNPVLLQKFDRIATNQPQKGDIVVLHGLAGSKFGHIVLCIDMLSPLTFLALEQNGAHSGEDVRHGDVVRTRQIPTARIAGVLRPKSSTPVNLPTYYTIKKGDTFWGLERAWGLKTGTLTSLNPTLNPRTLQVGQRIRRS